MSEKLILNEGQAEAVDRIMSFINSPAHFFLLSGRPGTGKTTCVKEIAEQVKGKIIFTAPTNKATKVLRETLTTRSYSPICKTTYSLLGMKMDKTGKARKIRAPKNPVNLADYKVVVVDEASMLKADLWNYLSAAAKQFHLKIVFLGDDKQLPPVNEVVSLVWKKAEEQYKLLEIIRFGSQIQILSDTVRTQIDSPCPRISFDAQNDGLQGIWNMDKMEFLATIQHHAREELFSKGGEKVIAWRNKTVEYFNRIIRAELFDNPEEQEWLPSDRILLSEPAINEAGALVGSTDEEGVIESIEVGQNPVFPEFTCWHISMLSEENRVVSLWVLHPDSQKDFANKCKELAALANESSWKWKDFWNFQEAFHSIKYAYAITAHRSQGSTYKTAFVVWDDILMNRNRVEGFKCLNVAITRPTTKLILGRM